MFCHVIWHTNLDCYNTQHRTLFSKVLKGRRNLALFWSIIPSFIGNPDHLRNNQQQKSRCATNNQRGSINITTVAIHTFFSAKGIWLHSVATWFNSWNEAVKRWTRGCHGKQSLLLKIKTWNFLRWRIQDGSKLILSLVRKFVKGFL